MGKDLEKKICFGNYLSRPDCRCCSQARECKDDQAGWGISQLEGDLSNTLLAENCVGKVPDWVFEWDSMSDEEILKMKLENPNRYRIYTLLNSGIRD